MDPLSNRREAATEVPPLIYYILPRAEAPIGPGDLEIEFEFEADFELDED